MKPVFEIYPMADDDDEVKALVQMLSRYLRDHPLASDTPDGISAWWLRLNWYVYESAICSALAWLVCAGLIEGVTGPDGRVRYRRVDSNDALAALGALANGEGDWPGALGLRPPLQ